MANLNGAKLSGANLSGANLSGANLQSANLRYTNLSYANLSWADLLFADIQGANLDGANLSYTVLEGVSNWAGFPDTVVESTTTTTIVTKGKLVDSDAGMICVPGSCTGNSRYRDSQYLKDVKTNVPRSYYEDFSDGQIFKMAYYWCNFLEQNQWTTIEELFDDVYKRGNRNEQLLSVWTLAGATVNYCMFTHDKKVGEFLGSLKYL